MALSLSKSKWLKHRTWIRMLRKMQSFSWAMACRFQHSLRLAFTSAVSILIDFPFNYLHIFGNFLNFLFHTLLNFFTQFFLNLFVFLRSRRNIEVFFPNWIRFLIGSKLFFHLQAKKSRCHSKNFHLLRCRKRIVLTSRWPTALVQRQVKLQLIEMNCFKINPIQTDLIRWFHIYFNHFIFLFIALAYLNGVKARYGTIGVSMILSSFCSICLVLVFIFDSLFLKFWRSIDVGECKSAAKTLHGRKW